MGFSSEEEITPNRRREIAGLWQRHVYRALIVRAKRRGARLIAIHYLKSRAISMLSDEEASELIGDQMASGGLPKIKKGYA
jgi:hypothetical protein